LRNGRLNQAAYSLFLFMRDVANGDFVGWIDRRLADADLASASDRAARLRQAVVEPLTHAYGVSNKVLSMALAGFLLAGDSRRALWIEAGAVMIAVDTLVHNFLHRTGILVDSARVTSMDPLATRRPAAPRSLRASPPTSMPAGSTRPSPPTFRGLCSTPSGHSAQRAGSTSATAGRSMIASAAPEPSARFFDCATAYPSNRKRTCKMTDTAPILVVFGIDPEGKPRASRFAAKDAEFVTKAAGLLGFRLVWIKDDAGRAIAEGLPDGNVFARGNGFVRLVRQSAFDKLSAAVDGGVPATPEKAKV